LSTEGKNIPTNDVWVAALAREHRLPLAAQDEHFSRVPDLNIVRW
jgi:predicted nucleic acid-binding protein